MTTTGPLRRSGSEASRREGRKEMITEKLSCVWCIIKFFSRPNKSGYVIKIITDRYYSNKRSYFRVLSYPNTFQFRTDFILFSGTLFEKYHCHL